MGNFCKYCGKPLQEGEVCDCVQQKGMNNQAGERPVEQYNSNQNVRMDQRGYYQQTPKRGVPRLLVPISQIVAGGLLVLEGFFCSEFAWGEIAFIVAVAFLITGICGLIEAKK